MQKKMMTERCLNSLQPGETGCVTRILSEGAMRRRLLELGLIEHTTVACVGKSPGGDPAAYLIRGAVIAIRAVDSKNIIVKVS